MIPSLIPWLLPLLAACSHRHTGALHSEYRTVTLHDTVSIAVERNDCTVARYMGDTICVEHWRTAYRDRWRHRVLRDTVILRDTVTVAVTPPAGRKYGGFLPAFLFLAPLLLVYACLLYKGRRPP